MSNKLLSKALFLDRDGVINIDHSYVSSQKQFQFVEGVFKACLYFQAQDYKIIVVTNQSGIARGYYTPQQFNQLTYWMCQQFAAHGVHITAVYHCPHHPTEGLPPYVKDCHCRKPEPGMLLKAMADHGIDPALSIMVGNKATDIKAASAVGIGYKVLVQSEHSFCSQDSKLADAVWPSLYNFAFEFHKQ